MAVKPFIRTLIRTSVLLAGLLCPLALDAADHTVCASGCDFTTVQAAINAAARGDNIILTAGETFTEAVTFPNKGGGTSPIVITSSASAGNLPGTGVRTGPQYASFMPKIKSPGGGAAAFTVNAGANYLTIRHVEFPHVPFGINTIFACGSATSSQSKLSDEPHDIILDRVYMHGDEIAGQKRAIDANCRNLTISNSFFDDFKAVGQDATVIGGWNTSGGHLVENNYIGGAAYGFLYGGGTVFMRTHFTVTGSASTTGAAVSIDEAGHNCSEVASGQHVAIETSAGVLFSNLTATPSAGTTCTLAWTAISTAPAVGQRVRLGINPTDLTITRNHIRKDPAWAQGPLARPTAPTATPNTSTGSLAAGTYYYRVQARGVGVGYAGNTVTSDVSLETSSTLTATGQIALDWPDITGETEWWVWRFTTPNAASGERTTVTGADAFTDDDTAEWTPAAYPNGSRWVVKNCFEIKVGIDVEISGNDVENCWRGADSGYAMWVKNVDQDGQNWYNKTSNVLIENNRFKSVCGWLLVEGRKGAGANPAPKPLNDVTIRNNLAYDVSPSACQTAVTWNILIVEPVVNLVIDHNTIIYTVTSGNGLMTLGNYQSTLTGFQFKNNLVTKGFYGIHHSAAFNKAALDLVAVGGSYTFQKNAIGYTDGTSAGTWPADNSLQTMTAWSNEFVSYSSGPTGGNFRLKDSSVHKLAGTDNLDLGVDHDELDAALAGVDPGPPPTDPPVITTTVLPDSLEDVSYGTQTVERAGGATPFTFSISAGALPTGLSINSSTGAITGTPTTAGAYSFTVRVVDNVAAEDTQDFTVTIYATASVTTTLVPNGTTGSAYNTTLAATGDQSPYTWAITAGALPSGLSLATNTGQIAGTPSAAGDFSFTVRATGALGSQDTQALAIGITSTSDQLPVGRPVAIGPMTQEAMNFRRTSEPTCADKPADGDVWADLSVDPAVIMVASVTMSGQTCSSVEWTPIASSSGALVGDGSALTDLNASELNHGTIPADVLPSLFPSAVTFGTSVTTPLVVVDHVDHVLQTCTQLSSPGFARQCVDGNSNAVLWSFDGGPYESGGANMTIGGNTPAISPMIFGTTNAVDVIWRTNGVNRINQNADGDLYLNTTATQDLAMWFETGATASLFGNGLTTSNGRKATLVANLGTYRSSMQFADASASGDIVWAVSASVNSGSLWTRWLGVTNTGAVLMKQPQLETQAAPTCNAANRGTLSYVAGGAGVKDVVQVCAKDASDNYAYRTIY